MTIDGFGDVPENDEAALKKAVAVQPVSVAICASGGLQFYHSGVVGGKCCDELDHGVLAVGYGVVSASSLQLAALSRHPVCLPCLRSMTQHCVIHVCSLPHLGLHAVLLNQQVFLCCEEVWQLKCCSALNLLLLMFLLASVTDFG